MNKMCLGLIVAITAINPANLFAQQDPSSVVFKDYPSPHGSTDTSATTESDLNTPVPYRTSTGLRQPSTAGISIGVYGGAIAFQEGDLHVTGPGISAKGSTQSEVGGVGGVRVEDTFPSFSALTGGGSSPNSTNLFMPAMGVDLFWTGYRYDASFSGGTSLRTDINSFSFMYTPKMKLNFGAWRPYAGFGVGGTYINSGNGSVVTGGSSKTLHGSSDDVDFSAEALAGCEVFVDPHWSLSLDYKYLYVLDPTFHGTYKGLPVQYKLDDLNNSLFTAGINFYF